jgi:hypothetical protein
LALPQRQQEPWSLGQEQVQALFPLVLMPKQALQLEQVQVQVQALEPWALIQGPWPVHQ